MVARRTPLIGRGEPVRVIADNNDGFPSWFTFRGRRYRVRSAEARPRPTEDSGRAAEWVEVRTDSGLRALLSRNRERNRWRMESILH